MPSIEIFIKQQHMRYLLLLLAVLMIISCNPDKAAVKESDSKMPIETELKPEQIELSTETGQQTAKTAKKTNYNIEGIPDACDLLSAETISRYVRQPVESIFLADGSSPKNPKARACFFKWDGSAIANAGVMVQLQRNPVQEDVPEYFTYLISSKKTDGEKDPAGGGTIKYKDWPGFGDDGAYSYVAGKYVWRVGNDWSFMIAFNTVLTEKAQKVAAETFANEVMSNMVFK